MSFDSNTVATSQQSKASSINRSAAPSFGANSVCGTSVCTTTSPSASSGSHAEGTSSCGTSPEPSIDSPGPRKGSEGAIGITRNGKGQVDSEGETAFCKLLSTACGTKENPIPLKMSHSNNASSAVNALTTGNDFLGIDWMAHQNGGVFDPILFSDYRDPQENVMSGDFGAFFNDAFPVTDLQTPTNAMLESKLPPKKSLMEEIEEQQSGKEPEVVPGEAPKQFLTCNMLW